MKAIKNVLVHTFILFAIGAGWSCDPSILEERPRDFFSPGNAYTDPKSIQLAINTLYADARALIYNDNGSQNGGYPYREYLRMGTDVATVGQKHRPYLMVDFRLFNSTHEASSYFWNKCYQTLIPRSNAIIAYAENPEVPWLSENEKSQALAQVRFFRAYAYYMLVNLYGEVPLITKEIHSPEFDFTRAPKSEILDFIRGDLEYASQYLISNPDQVPDGTLTAAAADMLLATLYIQLQEYDLAIETTSKDNRFRTLPIGYNSIRK